ncbi:hypothetical protein QWY82_05015 [Simiduia curdlanivorans]|uniref:Thioredoxin domain-containing protein n=1 Tax=Simiduia curdlanivorans TaxID=1492769 RepID=A0ABV8V446_9GAMM|nr:hypothetical protein [Simiduia curdlanivorans]MDN3638169.1 hypothetical protein [Simiduia curdlanivorans]
MQFFLFACLPATAQELRSAPDWLLVEQSGQTISFYNDSQGQASLLFFWTPACDQSCNTEVTQLYQQAQRLQVKMYLLKTTPGWRQSPLGELPNELQQLNNALSVSRHYGVNTQSKVILVNQRKQIVLRKPIRPNLESEEIEQLLDEMRETLSTETAHSQQ